MSLNKKELISIIGFILLTALIVLLIILEYLDAKYIFNSI